MKEVEFFFLHRMLQHELHWYEGLFRASPGEQPKAVRGEITPGYFRLKQWHVNRIAGLLPDLRIIVTLRHPIERAWSQIVYTLGRLYGRDLRTVHRSGFLRQLERPRTTLSSDYVRAIKVWSKAFGWEALHIGFFHELRDDPQRFIEPILRHIGASTPWEIPDGVVSEKVFATRNLVKGHREMPEVVEWYLAHQLLDSTEQLNVLLDGRVADWVDEMRTTNGRTRPTWRILYELNRVLLSIPERLAFHGYHSVEDLRFWLRWKRIVSDHKSGGTTTHNGEGTEAGPIHRVS